MVEQVVDLVDCHFVSGSHPDVPHGLGRGVPARVDKAERDILAPGQAVLAGRHAVVDRDPFEPPVSMGVPGGDQQGCHAGVRGHYVGRHVAVDQLRPQGSDQGRRAAAVRAVQVVDPTGQRFSICRRDWNGLETKVCRSIIGVRCLPIRSYARIINTTYT